MQDRISQSTMPYRSENDAGGPELVIAYNSEYKYTNSRKSVAIGETNAPKNFMPFNATFTTAWPAKLNVEFVNHPDQDDIINDEVAKNIKEGISDINSGRTYTSDQVKKMLGL